MATRAISDQIELYYKRLHSELLCTENQGRETEIFVDNYGHIYEKEKLKKILESQQKTCIVSHHIITNSVIHTALTGANREYFDRISEEDYLTNLPLALTPLKNFFCTAEPNNLLTEPVIDHHGHPFNRGSFNNYLEEGEYYCPLSTTDERVKFIIEDRALKNCVKFWKELQESITRIIQDEELANALASGNIPEISKEGLKVIGIIFTSSLSQSAAEISKIINFINEISADSLMIYLNQGLKNHSIEDLHGLLDKVKKWAVKEEIPDASKQKLESELSRAISNKDKDLVTSLASGHISEVPNKALKVIDIIFTSSLFQNATEISRIINETPSPILMIYLWQGLKNHEIQDLRDFFNKVRKWATQEEITEAAKQRLIFALEHAISNETDARQTKMLLEAIENKEKTIRELHQELDKLLKENENNKNNTAAPHADAGDEKILDTMERIVDAEYAKKGLLHKKTSLSKNCSQESEAPNHSYMKYGLGVGGALISGGLAFGLSWGVGPIVVASLKLIVGGSSATGFLGGFAAGAAADN